MNKMPVFRHRWRLPRDYCLRAVYGYEVTVSLADESHTSLPWRHIWMAVMPLGGRGPLWAVSDPDRLPKCARNLSTRFRAVPLGAVSH